MNQPPYGPPGQPQYAAAGPQGYMPQQPQQGPAAPNQKGFFGGLFDLSFTTFVTTRVIKVLYVLYLVFLVFGLIGGIASGLMAIASGVSVDLTQMIVVGVVQILLTPVLCIVALIYGRILFECIAVFFRVAEHLAEINRKTRE